MLTSLSTCFLAKVAVFQTFTQMAPKIILLWGFALFLNENSLARTIIPKPRPGEAFRLFSSLSSAWVFLIPSVSVNGRTAYRVSAKMLLTSSALYPSPHLHSHTSLHL